MRNHKYLFVFTILYFALGFVNIHTALIGIVCMLLPLILLFRNKRKTWCQGYCPRAGLYTTCGKLATKHSLKTPQFFIKGSMKWIMLAYFTVSLFMIVMSTVKVSSGARPPMEYLRFFIVIPLGANIPQLIEIANITSWVTHLSYRFYSMMMTTATLGLLLALIYKPRTWCTICPIATVSDVYLKRTQK